MRCPMCKARSDALETRERKDGAVRRRYLCHNMHKFSTVEVAALSPGRPFPVMPAKLKPA
jgi:transcriptional regulator NrdR family protein